MLKDYRGNEYESGAPLGVPCHEPGCTKEAVRHRCNAEGDIGRTHWHGGIHRLDGGGSGDFCHEHGMQILMANAKVLAQREKTR